MSETTPVRRFEGHFDHLLVCSCDGHLDRSKGPHTKAMIMGDGYVIAVYERDADGWTIRSVGERLARDPCRPQALVTAMAYGFDQLAKRAHSPDRVKLIEGAMTDLAYLQASTESRRRRAEEVLDALEKTQ